MLIWRLRYWFATTFLVWAFIIGLALVGLFLPTPALSEDNVGAYENFYLDTPQCDASGADFGFDWTRFLDSVGLIQLERQTFLTFPVFGRVQASVAAAPFQEGEMPDKVFHYIFVLNTGKICLMGTSEYLGTPL